MSIEMPAGRFVVHEKYKEDLASSFLKKRGGCTSRAQVSPKVQSESAAYSRERLLENFGAQES
jgi:hypothetical protein